MTQTAHFIVFLYNMSITNAVIHQTKSKSIQLLYKNSTSTKPPKNRPIGPKKAQKDPHKIKNEKKIRKQQSCSPKIAK